ncbi:type II toxin-antitoxin system HicA family toxin [Thiobacillus sp.]|jgi:hypothetical protein|uniref:type II toxin-antitoxin system HicA family toxin n=1 Tax=Thiobacillus sp. TaxID=924 RepID=UPI0034407D73
MSKQDKLIQRIKSRPKDFTWQELCSLLTSLDYVLLNGAGSRRKFFKATTQTVLILHEPHPRNYLLDYQVKAVVEHLIEAGVI